MNDLRSDPWVTDGGRFPLPPASEGTIEVDEDEVAQAVTLLQIGSVALVVQSVAKFKRLLQTEDATPAGPMAGKSPSNRSIPTNTVSLCLGESTVSLCHW